MFLIKVNDLFRRVRGEDDGIALAAVLALMGLGMLLTTMILSSVITGLGFTTSTRAGVQSQSSAESGLDVALAAMITGTSCQPTYTSNVVPKFTATLSYTTDAAVTTTTSWTPGCPTASAPFMKVTSVGTANSPGVAGNTSGNTKTIEAIYSRPITTQNITASGPAVYAYSSQDFGGSGTLVSADGTNDANVMLKTGDVNCSGGAASAGDLVVNNGNLTLSGSCGVTGNIWASGDANHGQVNLSGGVMVGGTIVARGVTINSGVVGKGIWSSGPVNIGPSTVGSTGVGGITATSGAITLNGTNTVNGSLWSSGNISITNGDTANNIYAQNITLNGGNVTGQAFAKFAVNGVNWYTISGSIIAQTVQSGMQAAGGITPYPAGTPALPAAPAAPTAPTVPNWVEFAYNQSDWAGFGVSTIAPGVSCTPLVLQAAIASFGGGKGVIDARNCSGPISLGGSGVLTMTNDLAIISSTGFAMNNGSITSLTPQKLWLITPDLNSADGIPTAAACPGANTVFSGGFSSSATIAMMSYTPCEVQIGSSVTYRGQVFSGSTKIDGAAHVTYIPVGLPGWNLSTGTHATTAAASNAWTIQSTRNIGG